MREAEIVSFSAMLESPKWLNVVSLKKHDVRRENTAKHHTGLGILYWFCLRCAGGRDGDRGGGPGGRPGL